MAEFTPGPWERDGATVYAESYKGEQNIHGAVACAVCSEGEIPFQEIANANLIAAAPDLYEICKEIREHFSYFSEWDLPLTFEDRLNAALAKAAGEGA